ncbi:MAG TPA: LysE family translocator [Solirubrobacteraceae bacterium]|nr:LysE family translocator [Solirubrobacteraceae bacterium]
MPSVSTLLLFVAASLALLAIPGPAVIYVVTRSIEQGRRAGLISMLGVELGTLTYALAATAGLSGLLAASTVAFTVVKYAGAAYLVVLGLRKLLERELVPAASSPRRPRLFINGLTVQLLNPKIAIFFVAFLPQFVTHTRGAATLQLLVLGVLFTALAVLSDGSYALVAGAVGRWLRRRARANQALMKLSGCIYIGLGVAAALSGPSGHASQR